MATPQEIQEVRSNLPSTAVSEGWTDQRIGDDIDAGFATEEIVRGYWTQQVAESAKYVNITESGSSRDLSAIHRQATDMMKYWDQRIKERDTGPMRSTARVHISRRV